MLANKLNLTENKENKENNWFDIVLSLLILSSIIGFLSVRGWTNTCLYILLALSLFHIKRNFKHSYQIDNSIQLNVIFIILALPIASIFISQLGRQDWLFKAYDSPSRMFFSIPILLLLIYKKVNFSHLLGLAAPLALLTTAISIYQHPEVISRWGGRFATTFVDPTAFGPYAVVLSSICLFHLDVSFQSSKLWFFYQSIGLLTALFLITGSGTRGSWLAIPAIFILWLHLNYRKISLPFSLICTLLLASYIAGTLFYFPHSYDRFLSGFSETINWFKQSKLDSSTGLRLSMWKISWHLFIHKPVFGYGDLGIAAYLDKPWFSSTATAKAIEMIKCCGPHNELLANALRSGITGIISTLSLFIVPFVFFAKNAYHCKPEIAKASHIGLAYITCLAISSLSSEIFTLKYTSSFYGLMIAGLAAQIISASLPPPKKN